MTVKKRKPKKDKVKVTASDVVKSKAAVHDKKAANPGTNQGNRVFNKETYPPIKGVDNPKVSRVMKDKKKRKRQKV
jgi:hypothetical protein